MIDPRGRSEAVAQLKIPFGLDGAVMSKINWKLDPREDQPRSPVGFHIRPSHWFHLRQGWSGADPRGQKCLGKRKVQSRGADNHRRSKVLSNPRRSQARTIGSQLLSPRKYPAPARPASLSGPGRSGGAHCGTESRSLTILQPPACKCRQCVHVRAHPHLLECSANGIARAFKGGGGQIHPEDRRRKLFWFDEPAYLDQCVERLRILAHRGIDVAILAVVSRERSCGRGYKQKQCG